MGFNSNMSKADITDALVRAADATWGPERSAAIREALERAASAIWTVLQVQLDPMGEEPDLPEEAPPRIGGGHTS